LLDIHSDLFSRCRQVLPYVILFYSCGCPAHMTKDTIRTLTEARTKASHSRHKPDMQRETHNWRTRDNAKQNGTYRTVVPNIAMIANQQPQQLQSTTSKNTAKGMDGSLACFLRDSKKENVAKHTEHMNIIISYQKEGKKEDTSARIKNNRSPTKPTTSSFKYRLGSSCSS